MRLICPSCIKDFVIADTEAGKTVACPQCAHSFSAPQTYLAPPVEPLPGPPPAPPPTPPRPLPMTDGAVAKAPPPAPPPAATPTGYLHRHGVSLGRKVCEWLPPIALTFAFFLTFFTWFGLYPAGYAAYTQNAWQALFASMSVDPVSEKLFESEKALNNALQPSLWLLPYFLLLLVSVALAWMDHVLKWLKIKRPAIVERFWSHRHALLSACVGGALFFLLVQCVAGFGLERARSAKIEAANKEAREKARTPEEIQMVEMQVAREIGGLYPQTTTWLRLAILCHFLAWAGIIGETVLLHRGQKPPPRVEVMW